MSAPQIKHERRHLRESSLAWAATALLLCGLAAGFRMRASTVAGRHDVHAEAVQELLVLQSRVSLARAHLDELTRRILEPAGISDIDDIQSATENRVETIAREKATLQELTDHGGPSAQQALTLLDALNRWGPTDPEADDPYTLLDGLDSAQYEASPPPSNPPTQRDSIREAMWLDQEIIFVLHESVLAAFVQQWPDPNDSASTPVLEDFMYGAARSVEEDPGYFGSDRSSPMPGPWITTDVVSVHESKTVEVLNQVVNQTHLWDADQWVRSWRNGPLGPAPITLQDLTAEADLATSQAREILDARLRELMSESTAQASQAGRNLDLYHAATLFTLLLAVAAGAYAVAVALRKAQAIGDLANTDPLTGIGNRNVLATHTSKFLVDKRLSHHAVVTIDMDRFKVVNDSYGHLVGDELLQHIANGLVRIADSGITAESSAVRLGGDEFLLSLHDSRPIDVARVRRRLDGLRHQTIVTKGGAQVAVEFSYGLAIGDGRQTLRDLMDASDLAAYEEKAIRLSLQLLGTNSARPVHVSINQ